MRQLLTSFIVAMLFFTACQTTDQKEQWQKGEDGLRYIIHKQNPENQSIDIGYGTVLNVRCLTPADSLLYEGAFKIGIILPKQEGACLERALLMLHRGDSASFLVEAGLFYEHTLTQALPKSLKESDLLRIDLKVYKVLDKEEIAQERHQKFEQNCLKENERIGSFLLVGGKSVDSTAAGLYVIEHQKGEGVLAKDGDTLIVDYAGQFLTGTIFDKTYGEAPVKLVLGKAPIIEGLEQALRLMHKGSRLQVLIPSKLAYGEQGLFRDRLAKRPPFPPTEEHYGDIRLEPFIPPCSPLIFSIELHDIKQ